MHERQNDNHNDSNGLTFSVDWWTEDDRWVHHLEEAWNATLRGVTALAYSCGNHAEYEETEEEIEERFLEAARREKGFRCSLQRQLNSKFRGKPRLSVPVQETGRMALRLGKYKDEGYQSCSDIAEVLGVSPETVRLRLKKVEQVLNRGLRQEVWFDVWAFAAALDLLHRHALDARLLMAA